MATFRDAMPDEDEVVARILYNAFLLNWDINWWQDLSEKLEQVSLNPLEEEQLSEEQTKRLRFYQGVVNFTRILKGSVTVAVPPESDKPAAVLLWFPPYVRPTLSSLLSSGWLGAAFGFGLRGVYRIWYFEHCIADLYSKSLSKYGYQQVEGAFVQIIATNPKQAGKGYASGLLQWRIEKHKHEYPGVPVFLDTASTYAKVVYERLGFKELVQMKLETGRNKNGLTFTENVSIEERESESQDHVQRIMMLDCVSDEINNRLPRKRASSRIGEINITGHI